MSVGAALLRAVCDRPDDDAPRLVYADWLDESAGRTPDPDATAARAEFIRVQVRLARTPGAAGCHPPGGHAGAGGCPACALAARAKRLFARLRPEAAGGGTGRGPWALRFPHLRQWERGFPASVEGIVAELWLTHADDILARYPIRRVALAAWPAADVFDGGARAFRFRGWRPHQFTDWVDPSGTDRTFIRRALAEEWPGIAFEFPPGPDRA